MKKIFAFVLALLLYFCPLEVNAGKIAEAPSPDPMSQKAITYLIGEDIYQATLSWQGKKLLPNIIGSRKRKNS